MHQKLLALLATIQPNADFAHSQDFLDDGLIDSMDVILITAAIEETFGVSIPGDQITPENYGSLERLAALIARSGGGGA